MKIVFAGTPQFALPFLDALVTSPHTILAVYTQPDKPAGRGLQLTASPVKQQALTHRLPIYQPKNLKDPTNQQQLQQLNPDIFVDVAYGVLLPPTVLHIPHFGCINVHPSLLPRWRGASPIQHALLAGDVTTGVTIMQIDEGLDTGPILQQTTITIDPTDTSATLSDKLAHLGVKMLLETLQKIENHTCQPTPQDNQFSTYAAKINKEDAKINWQQSAITISRMVRAYNSWPIAYSTIDQQIVRIWQAIPITDENIAPLQKTSTPGTIIAANKNGIDIVTGDSILRILQLQLPGKKVLAAKDILNAYAKLFKIGGVFL